MIKTFAKSLLILLFVSGCRDSNLPQTDTEAALPADAAADTQVAAETPAVLNFKMPAAHFSQLAQSTTRAMLTACATMQIDIEAFLLAPSEQTQANARQSFLPCYQSWKAASLFFQQPFSFSEQEDFDDLIDLIDTRPFLPGYIGGIDEYPFSGLVHELDIEISPGTLRSQHRLMDEDSASVGFPVIEFFLWKIPTQSFWLTNEAGDKQNIIERRHDYLSIATTLLLEHLSKAVVRWQNQGEFDKLPEAAQQVFVLKSLQRLSMIDLLGTLFEESAVSQPQWHHPALISGQGRVYTELQLQTIQALIGEKESEFATWLSDAVALPFSADELISALAQALAAIEQLPENYPSNSVVDDNWLAAQKQIASVALMFSQLSEHFLVPIVTQ